MATLFAVVTIVLVAAYSAAGRGLTSLQGAEEVLAVQAADGGSTGGTDDTDPSTTSSSSSTSTSTTSSESLQGPSLSPSEALSGVSDGIDPATSEPADTTTTSAPTTTTEETTTTEADTTLPDETSSSTDDTSDTTDPDSTSTTEDPGSTTNPDGWVDTGNGVLVPPVLLEIRRCESTNNYQAANPSSSARGAYQFTTGSWEAYGHADRYGVSQAHLASPAQQDEAALLTWQEAGTTPWNASKSCWG